MKDALTVEIVSVGTELLLGNIINTNAAFLAEECAKLGLFCYYQSTVGDNEERICDTLRTALSRSDIVIVSGGLGPTQDDVTKEAAAKVCGKELFMHEESKARLIAYFEKRGTSFTENNYKQALVPKDAVVLTNNNGTAPGLIIPYKEKSIVLLPGVQTEMRALFTESVVPYIKGLSPKAIVSKTVKVVSIIESRVETMIKDLIDSQINPTLATYAKKGEVHIRVTASADTEEEAGRLLKPVIRELKKRFGNNIYTTDENVTLEKSIIDLLNVGKLKAMTVESCTAGLVASRLVNVPGASEVFKCGLITYSNKAKRKLLGVKKSTLEKFTAVSEETAYEMVKEPEVWKKSDVCVGVTGYASDPGDASLTGLVYISCNVCGKITVKEYHFNGNRAMVRESATTQALVLMRQCILEYLSEQTFKE